MSISSSQKSKLKSQNSQAIQTIQNPKSKITKSSHDCATPKKELMPLFQSKTSAANILVLSNKI
jgi:hypothetical protein